MATEQKSRLLGWEEERIEEEESEVEGCSIGKVT